MGRNRILITGTSGRLGSAAADILGRDHDIVGLDVKPPAVDPPPGSRRLVGSVADRAAVAEAMEGVDTVIHCGAIPSSTPPFDALLQTNVAGTVNLLEEAGRRREVERFVFVSSIRVHGVLEEVRPEFMPRFLPFDETHPYLTVEYYGGGKLHAEHWCRMYVRRFGKPVVVFRPSYILPRDAEDGFRPQPAPDYPDLVQYVATSDLIEAMRLALDHEPADGFDCFLTHAADQRSTTPTLEFVDRHFPGVLADREKLAACGGFAALVDCSRARERLGWRPRFSCRR